MTTPPTTPEAPPALSARFGLYGALALGVVGLFVGLAALLTQVAAWGIDRLLTGLLGG